MNKSDKIYYVLSSDPILKKVIDRIGVLDFPTKSDNIYVDIVETIINQQLSGKAAETIFGSVKKLFPHEQITPEILVTFSDEAIRKAGLSFAKIKYIKALSQSIISRELLLDRLTNLSDERVIYELIKIKGIGRWTAEMILMFSLGRPDVFSIGDMGLRTAVSKLYGIKRENLKKIEKVSYKWIPYRTIASRYLWRSLE